MSTKRVGEQGEIFATQYLINLGHKIVTRNFRYKKLGEIDIISTSNNVLHFVEVKTRKNDNYGSPFEAVNYKKLSKIIKVAEVFREQSGLFKLNYQFDIVSITLDIKKIEYFQNITL